MKGIISKVPVTILDRRGTRKGIVFIAITNDSRSTLAGQRKLEVTDYEVIQNENPLPGERLYEYLLIDRNDRIRKRTDTDAVWSYLAKDLVHTESLEEQLDSLYADFLLVDTQQNPIRDSQPEDWELHTENTEVAP